MYLRFVKRSNTKYPVLIAGIWIFIIALVSNFSYNPAFSAGPRAVILEPLNNSYITTTPVTMRIIVTHPFGVISDSLQVSVDGKVIGKGDWSSVTPLGITSEEIEYVKDISGDFITAEGSHHIEVIDAFSSATVSEGLSNGPVACDFIYDSIAPEVLKVLPISGATTESVRPVIEIHFSESMNRESVERAFSMALLDPGKYIGKSGVFSWNDDSSIMTFIPSADLIEGITYEIILLNTATDVAGAKIQTGFKQTFEVINTVSPSLVTTIPVDNTQEMAIDSKIVIIFSHPIDISTLSNIVLSSEKEVKIDRIEVDPLSDVSYLLVPEALSPHTKYTLTVPKTVYDLRGNQLDQKYVISFTTKDLGKTLEAGAFVIPGDPENAVVIVRTNEAVGSSLAVTVKQKGAPSAFPLVMKMIKSPKNEIYLYKGIYSVNRNFEFFGIAEVGVSAKISGVMNNKTTTFIVRE